MKRGAMMKRQFQIFGFFLTGSLVFTMGFPSVGIPKSLGKHLFPNSKLVWEKHFYGQIWNIQVGGENMLVFWGERGKMDGVSYLDQEDNILWEKRFHIKQDEQGEHFGYVYNVSLSQDGKHFIISSEVSRDEVRFERVN
ncbi:hypothetical protein IIA15_08440, partial [candidate division TA06 bacterium]|nr:hypothetical protein [candidate division TA06 bacterium]